METQAILIKKLRSILDKLEMDVKEEKVSIGDLSGLHTTAKSTLVEAINEVRGHLPSNIGNGNTPVSQTDLDKLSKIILVREVPTIASPEGTLALDIDDARLFINTNGLADGWVKFLTVDGLSDYYTKTEVNNLIPTDKLNLIIVDSDPNENTTSAKGTIAIDKVTPTLWQNTDGDTAWVDLINTQHTDSQSGIEGINDKITAIENITDKILVVAGAPVGDTDSKLIALDTLSGKVYINVDLSWQQVAVKSTKLISISNNVFVFTPNFIYNEGSTVFYQGFIYESKDDFTSGSQFDVNDWNKIEYVDTSSISGGGGSPSDNNNPSTPSTPSTGSSTIIPVSDANSLLQFIRDWTINIVHTYEDASQSMYIQSVVNISDNVATQGIPMLTPNAELIGHIVIYVLGQGDYQSITQPTADHEFRLTVRNRNGGLRRFVTISTETATGYLENDPRLSSSLRSNYSSFFILNSRINIGTDEEAKIEYYEVTTRSYTAGDKINIPLSVVSENNVLVRTTPQNLSDSQKINARSNIGVDSSVKTQNQIENAVSHINTFNQFDKNTADKLVNLAKLINLDTPISYEDVTTTSLEIDNNVKSKIQFVSFFDTFDSPIHVSDFVVNPNVGGVTQGYIILSLLYPYLTNSGNINLARAVRISFYDIDNRQVINPILIKNFGSIDVPQGIQINDVTTLVPVGEREASRIYYRIQPSVHLLANTIIKLEVTVEADPVLTTNPDAGSLTISDAFVENLTQNYALLDSVSTNLTRLASSVHQSVELEDLSENITEEFPDSDPNDYVNVPLLTKSFLSNNEIQVTALGIYQLKRVVHNDPAGDITAFTATLISYSLNTSGEKIGTYIAYVSPVSSGGQRGYLNLLSGEGELRQSPSEISFTDTVKIQIQNLLNTLLTVSDNNSILLNAIIKVGLDNITPELLALITEGKKTLSDDTLLSLLKQYEVEVTTPRFNIPSVDALLFYGIWIRNTDRPEPIDGSYPVIVTTPNNVGDIFLNDGYYFIQNKDSPTTLYTDAVFTHDNSNPDYKLIDINGHNSSTNYNSIFIDRPEVRDSILIGFKVNILNAQNDCQTLFSLTDVEDLYSGRIENYLDIKYNSSNGILYIMSSNHRLNNLTIGTISPGENRFAIFYAYTEDLSTEEFQFSCYVNGEVLVIPRRVFNFVDSLIRINIKFGISGLLKYSLSRDISKANGTKEIYINSNTENPPAQRIKYVQQGIRFIEFDRDGSATDFVPTGANIESISNINVGYYEDGIPFTINENGVKNVQFFQIWGRRIKRMYIQVNNSQNSATFHMKLDGDLQDILSRVGGAVTSNSLNTGQLGDFEISWGNGNTFNGNSPLRIDFTRDSTWSYSYDDNEEITGDTGITTLSSVLTSSDFQIFADTIRFGYYSMLPDSIIDSDRLPFTISVNSNHYIGDETTRFGGWFSDFIVFNSVTGRIPNDAMIATSTQVGSSLYDKVNTNKLQLVSKRSEVFEIDIGNQGRALTDTINTHWFSPYRCNVTKLVLYVRIPPVGGSVVVYLEDDEEFEELSEISITTGNLSAMVDLSASPYTLIPQNLVNISVTGVGDSTTNGGNPGQGLKLQIFIEEV